MRIQTEEATTRLISKVTDSQNKINRAEAELQIAAEKLGALEERLKTVNDALSVAATRYDALSMRVETTKRAAF